MKKQFTLLLTILLVCFSAGAQSMVSTRYFGPYAFPVPDPSPAYIIENLSVEVSGDMVMGYAGGVGNTDWTYAPTFRVSVPLWNRRASFSVYGEMHEFYSDTPATRLARNVTGDYPLKGNDSGNLYLSLSALLLKELENRPAVTFRAVTLTATGDNYEVARHYDAPGYYFDLAVGKNFRLGTEGKFRMAWTVGFVCWQIGSGTQNDAWLSGLWLSYSNPGLDAIAGIGGYYGREYSAISPDSGDRPASVKARVNLHFGAFTPFIYVQHGLRDWPFTQFRVGCAWSFDILKWREEKTRRNF